MFIMVTAKTAKLPAYGGHLSSRQLSIHTLGQASLSPRRTRRLRTRFYLYGRIRGIILRILIEMIRTGRGIRTVQDQAEHAGLPLEEQFQTLANDPGMGEMASHYKQGAIHLGSHRGGVVRCKYRTAVNDHVIILLPEPCQKLV